MINQPTRLGTVAEKWATFLPYLSMIGGVMKLPSNWVIPRIDAVMVEMGFTVKFNSRSLRLIILTLSIDKG